MPQLLSIYRNLHYRQGGYSLAGIYIIHIYGIYYYIYHLAEDRNKLLGLFSRKNISRGSPISKTHFAFYRRK